MAEYRVERPTDTGSVYTQRGIVTSREWCASLDATQRSVYYISASHGTCSGVTTLNSALRYDAARLLTIPASQLFGRRIRLAQTTFSELIRNS